LPRKKRSAESRICAAHLAEPGGGAPGTGGEDTEWAVVRLRFAAVPAARTLLSFGGDVEVVSPPEIRADLASVAAAVIARYAGSADDKRPVTFPERSGRRVSLHEGD
jgi:hypothetical protein